MFTFMEYTELFFRLIHDPPGNTYDINTMIINDSITKQFLVTILNYYMDDRLTIFWIIHLYTYYVQLFRNDVYRYKNNIKKAIEQVLENLYLVSNQICRQNNNYEVDYFNGEYYILLTNLINTMHKRQEINKIDLENVEEQENSFSLRNIYMCDIIEDKDLLRTIIIDFGEQSEAIFETIYNNIYKEYTTAKNYFRFDKWIQQIGIYQQKVLNVFKTVLMHLMRKKLMYVSLLLENKQKVDAIYGLKKLQCLIENTIILFDGQEACDVEKVFKSFNQGYYHNDLILNIDNIINKIKPNSFKLISNDLINDLINDLSYKLSINVKTEKYIKYYKLNKDDLKFIKYLYTISDSKEMNNHLVNIFYFTKLFDKIFQSVNIKSILSYLKFTETLEIFNFEDENNDENNNEIRLLDL
ncbi:uncharacterized protein LOC126900182 [Daktulosphaira vitifoliae]|uniref:uncharacterized protein LOC126900182 n=1 Tax=Daktulosphaira vitifoliae TaxID=58002 RepID=UPI0021AA447A|nr:uncharacterized protein LOC126900182 [Daktulosphaira vitifoliae]